MSFQQKTIFISQNIGYICNVTSACNCYVTRFNCSCIFVPKEINVVFYLTEFYLSQDGRFQVDGVEWKLNHRGLTDDLGTYNATEVIPDVNKNSVGGIKPEDGKVRESKDKMNFVYKMLNACMYECFLSGLSP